ncbi:chromosome loss-related protein [Madurella fahalii]|uniref:Chromosome loss-related protein n=1 Tax=Madurella fahalii TaxID=1157608 RepID=A0ABQ0G775_9PEZI
MPRISVPTTARLPSSLRVDPKNPAVSKILSRLSRSSLLSVALDWLDENNLPLTQPYLRGASDEENDSEDDETDDFYPPARSHESLQELYTSLQSRKGSKREILDRILEGDWRHGLSLYQLAMADLQYLYDHPTSQKWAAYRIVPLKPPTDPDGEDPPEVDKQSLTIPRFHPSTFLRSLQTQTLPDIKAHYTFDTHRTLPILLLRIFILDSPYNTNLGLQPAGSAMAFDSARTVYIAFPDASPHVYISKPQQTTTTTAATAAASGSNPAGGGESKSLRNLILEGIPKALSNPLRRQRFTLRSTNLATRNLAELVERRGAGRTNSAGGGWSVYADEKVKESPLDLAHHLPVSPPLSGGEGEEEEEEGVGKEKRKRARDLVETRAERAAKRAKMVARARFGETGKVGDGKGVERVDVVIEDAFPAEAGVHDSDGNSGGEGEEEEEVAERGRPAAGTGARGSGGRKSQVDAHLGGLAEDEEDDADEAQRQNEWRPYVRLTFHGSHVFAGIRQLVECGIVDGERMPGWLTGEEGVTIGAVRNGRIRGHKGSGL